jgi:glycosyltransferase involved in cell wall biosynthesis
MRILLLGDIRPAHLKRWRDYFRSEGHDVMVVSLEEDASDGDYVCISSKVPVQVLKYYLKKNAVREITSQFKPDIVNSHFVPSYGVLGVATGFHPLVVTLWGSDILVSPHKSRLHRVRALWVLRNSDLITSDSMYMTDEARNLGEFDTEIVTEPMGISRSVLDTLEKHNAATHSNESVIISTRRLEPLYRVDALIDALSKVREKLLPFRCIISGDGSERVRLESMARSRNLDEVTFVGWKSGDEYLDLIGNADVYVSCSESDSTSVSLLEAMAAGALPVVSDIPGNREWVKDGESALMFPVGDADALASRLVQAITDPELREGAAQINRSAVESRAVWEENMNAIEGAFEELVAKTRE